jgi:hypothetical protein
MLPEGYSEAYHEFKDAAQKLEDAWLNLQKVYGFEDMELHLDMVPINA